MESKETLGLESMVENSEESSRRINKIDKGGAITYSLVVGTALDYASGLGPMGIITSRAYTSGVNYVTGGWYGKKREDIFRWTNTNENSSWLRKRAVDLLVFNAIQVPIYASAVALASFFNEGEINLEKVKNGSIYLASVSPVIGPTMNIWMDVFRRLFGIKSAAEGAYENN